MNCKECVYYNKTYPNKCELLRKKTWTDCFTNKADYEGILNEIIDYCLDRRKRLSHKKLGDRQYQIKYRQYTEKIQEAQENIEKLYHGVKI